MKELLKEMMDRGFLICSRGPDMSEDAPSKFILKKVATPVDIASVITHRDTTDASVEYFPTFEEALERARMLMDWRPEPKSNIEKKHNWLPQLMYEHTGLGSKIVDLQIVCNCSYDDAMDFARLEAEGLLASMIDDGVISKWDVRIRPC